MGKLVKVSFIIRTLNEGTALEEVLRRIRLLEDSFRKEILVVDSGSTDRTLDIVIRFRRKYGTNFAVKIIHITQDDWSWGRALNLGIEEAGGEFIVIISGHSFISKSSFLKESIKFFKDDKVAAVYGQQKPISNFNPFEEYELLTLYPDLEYYPMDHKTIATSQEKGVSNACSVIKKSAWNKVKYDEDLQSLEDCIWAFNVTRLEYSLVYSNTFSIYHSHPFQPEYLYRKWYWRNFESQNYIHHYLIYSQSGLKRKLYDSLKKYLLRGYLSIKSLKAKKEMQQLLEKYSFIKDQHRDVFLKIQNEAIVNSTRDFFQQKKDINYWSSLDIPRKVNLLVKRISEMQESLSRDYSNLKGSLPYES